MRPFVGLLFFSKMRYLLFLLLLLPLCLPAQADAPATDEPVQLFQEESPAAGPRTAPPVTMRRIPEQQWADASKNLDYSKDQMEVEKPREYDRDFAAPNFSRWTALTQWLGSWVQVLAIVLAAGLIGYAVYRMLQAPRNRVIASDGVEITVENLDQYILETDLERFLREALAAGNYPLAIRLYYLQIIKDLAGKNVIKWSREKTNRDYQREMRQHRLAEPFRLSTLRYEEVWYGNQQLRADDYTRLEPDFKQLLQEIARG